MCTWIISWDIFDVYLGFIWGMNRPYCIWVVRLHFGYIQVLEWGVGTLFRTYLGHVFRSYFSVMIRIHLRYIWATWSTFGLYLDHIWVAPFLFLFSVGIHLCHIEGMVSV